MRKVAQTDGIQLIAIDLDGTLLTSQGTLAPEGAHLLRKAAQGGKYVVLATTRNPDSVCSFCAAMELNDPIICTNGAQVWGTPNGPVWAYHAIPYEAALTITNLADAHGWELSTTVGQMNYWRQRPGQALGSNSANVSVVATNSDALVGEPVRILTWHPDAVAAVKHLCQLELTRQCYAETYYRPDGAVHSLGVFALKADKGTALQLVLNRLGLSGQQVLAIGDNFNDLPLFAQARVRVALANAPDAVKQKASVVAPSHDEEGVAWTLRAFGVV